MLWYDSFSTTIGYLSNYDFNSEGLWKTNNISFKNTRSYILTWYIILCIYDFYHAFQTNWNYVFLIRYPCPKHKADLVHVIYWSDTRIIKSHHISDYLQPMNISKSPNARAQYCSICFHGIYFEMHKNKIVLSWPTCILGDGYVQNRNSFSSQFLACAAAQFISFFSFNATITT